MLSQRSETLALMAAWRGQGLWLQIKGPFQPPWTKGCLKMVSFGSCQGLRRWGRKQIRGYPAQVTVI